MSSTFRPPRPVVLPVRPDPTGRDGPTPSQARGPRWRRAAPGLFVPAGVDPDRPEQRVAEAAALLPDDGAVTGWGALLLAGARYLDGHGLPVRLTVGHGAKRLARPGVQRLQERVGAIVEIRGVPVHAPHRAVFDEMRLARDLTAAVVAADMASAAGVVSLDQLRRLVDGCRRRRGGWRGVDQARRALSLASDQAASPPETRLRLLWLHHGLPCPLVNQGVYSLVDGHLLGYPDLLDVEAGHVVEYDGEGHRELEQQTDDNRRREDFLAHGLVPTHVTALDLRRPDLLGPRLAEVRTAALVSARPRLWTLAGPAGRRTALHGPVGRGDPARSA